MSGRKQVLAGYALCLALPDGRQGWLMDENLDVKVYPTCRKAEQARDAMLKNTAYHWSLPLEIHEYDPTDH